MAVIITLEDLSPFAAIDPLKAEAMISDAVAMAALVAPCILTDEFVHHGAARAIIRGAILRWNEAGTGAAQQVQSGPFGMTVDTRQNRRGMFWPSEIQELARLCTDAASSGKAFEIDTVPPAAQPGYWSQPDTWVSLT